MIIRQCFDYAVDTLRLIPENTFRKVKIQTKLLKKYVKKDDSTQVFLTDETSLIFKSAMADLEKNPNNTAPLAVMLTFFTGLRRGEIVSLRYSDTTFNTLQICHMERDIYDYSDIENVSYVGKKVIDGAKTDAGVRPADAAAQFGYKGREFVITRALDSSKKMSTGQIGLCLSELLSADERLKSTSTDGRTILEELMVKLVYIMSEGEKIDKA